MKKVSSLISATLESVPTFAEVVISGEVAS